MGTVFAVRVDDVVAPEVLEEVGAWWRDVEARFSTFRDDSQVSRIGRGELEVDDADPDVRHVLATCAELEELSGGRFTITPPGGSGLDPAGYVKGWSVDEAGLLLRRAGADRFIVYAGGDVLCGGAPEDDSAWRVGLRLPWDRQAVGAVVSLTGGAVATSGAYERGDHIWGLPHGEPLLLGATVVGPSLGVADALATAVYADQSRSLGWLGRFPGYGVVLFTADRKVEWSASLDGQVDVAASG